jgi:hypothetical protein
VFGGRLGFRIGRTGARANRGVNAKADSAKDDLVDDDLMRRALDMAEDLDDDDDEFDMLDTVEGAIASTRRTAMRTRRSPTPSRSAWDSARMTTKPRWT